MTFLSRVVTILVLFTPFAGAQFTALITLDGATAGDHLGRAVAVVDDVDGDGVSDILVGLPGADGAGLDAGQARVYSGATGGILIAIDGLQPGDRFGTSVAGLGDLNGDGLSEFAVGAPGSDVGGTDSGSVRVFAAPTGALLYSLAGTAPFDGFGESMTGLADWNADGMGDFAIGAPRVDQMGADFGQVTVYSGVDGSLIATFTGDAPGDEFGSAIADAGDVNMDGVTDLLVGVQLADTQGAFSNAGLARVYSGADQSQLLSIDGQNQVDLFGSAVAGLGDINGDGHADILVVARLEDGGATDSGVARAYSGADGSLIFTIMGTAMGEQLGFSAAAAGDFDGDGTPDIALGAPFAAVAGADSGAIRFYSGVDGSLLLAIDGAEAGAQLGIATSGGADFNGDGLGDVLVGAYLEDDGAAVDAGRARVYTFLDPAILSRFEGLQAGDQLGESVDAVGDVNGDGIPDLVVGARLSDVAGTSSGAAYVISGADGSQIHAVQGAAALTEFGTSVTGLGDWDGDSVPDFAIGAPREDLTATDEGAVHVFSGATGMEIATFNGEANQDQFGFSVSDAGDVNGDGISDLVVGAPRHDVMGTTDAGRVYIFSGADNSQLATADGTEVSGQLGWSVAGVGDVNGDGTPDVVAGARLEDGNGVNSGKIYVFSGVDLSVIVSQNGPSGSAQFGYSVAGAGDVDGDGSPDIVAGAPFDTGGGSEAGLVRVMKGSDLAVIHTLTGTSAMTRFGFSVDGGGDIDGDGFADIVVGAPKDDANGTDAGALTVYSGIDGSLLYTHKGEDANDELGYGVTGLGDVDGDGFPEVAVGARLDDDGGTDAGSVRILRLPIPTIHYPGSREDLFLFTGVNGVTPDRLDDIKDLHVGDQLVVNWRTFQGTFDIYPPILIGQFFVTGTPPTSPPGFPEVHSNPGQVPPPVLVFDGNVGPFGPLALPPGGITLAFTAPPGIAGNSFIFQALAATNTAVNGFFAITHGHEVRFVP